MRFGSLAQYRAYFQLPEDAVQRFLNRHNKLFQRYQIASETVAEQEEDLTRALGRLARYLGLVGLIALLLGGLGVGSAVNVFVMEKLDSAALLRCLGARQRTVLAVYLLQAMALGLVGAGAGVVLGVVVQAALPAVLGGFLPLDVSVTLQWSTILAGLGIGVGTAALFALLPLLQLREVSPLRVLRRELDLGAGPRAARPWRLAVYGTMLAGLVGLARWQAPRPIVGYAFAVGVLVSTAASVAHREGPDLGDATLVPAPRQLRGAPGDRQPVPPPEPDRRGGARHRFRRLSRSRRCTSCSGVSWGSSPSMRGRTGPISCSSTSRWTKRTASHVSSTPAASGRSTSRRSCRRGSTRVNGRPIDSLAADSSRRRSPWALRREYRNTYRDTLVSSERLIAGSWWSAARREGELPRISVEEELAAEAGLRVGDRVTWNVQGVPVETRVASLRQVSWARFQPNFFVVFEPGVLERAPQTFVVLARSEDPVARAELQRDVTLAYPNVASLDLDPGAAHARQHRLQGDARHPLHGAVLDRERSS